jgi:hypothetical protein
LDILKNIIIAMPDERPLPEETQNTILEIFGHKEPEPVPDNTAIDDDSGSDIEDIYDTRF